METKGLTIFVIILLVLVVVSYIWLIVLSAKLGKKADIEPEKTTEESSETFINY